MSETEDTPAPNDGLPNTISAPESEDLLPTGCGLWLGWMVATLIGSGAGWAAGWALSYLAPGALATPVLGVTMGALVGLAQWPLLRQRIPNSGWWVAASAVGWGMGFLTGAELASLLGLEGILFGLTAGITTGLLTGALQWMLLRGTVTRAGWWAPASGFAWASALIYYRPAAPWLGLLMGALVGIVTAIVLLWLFHRPE